LKPFAGIGALLAALGIATSPFAQERMPPHKAIELMKAGSYIICSRHLETDADTPDQHLLRLDDCARSAS
jgi:hypothetical protein